MTDRPIRRRVWTLLDVARPGDRASLWVDRLLVTLILANIAAFVLETVPEYAGLYGVWFRAFEWISVIVFASEYALRVWSVPESEHDRGRLRYILRPMMIIDFLAFAPSLILVLGIDLRSLRVLRLMRIARLSKLGRYSMALQTVSGVLVRKREELVVSVGLLVFLLFIASTAMYYAEREAQPDVFRSIPDSMWWGIVTLTTVGYGDTYPVTPVGRVLAGCVSLMGIGLVAIPTGILASGFSDEFARRRSRDG